MTAVSARELRLEFSSPHHDPAAFDDPALAVLSVPAGGGVSLEILGTQGGDMRDFLDAPDSTVATTGTMIVTRSPAAVEYARQLGEWRIVPLAWDVAHLLMVSGGGEPIRPDSAALAALARDAVPGDARAAGEQGWWDIDPACQEPPTQMRPVGRRLAYLEGDPVGRGLAERLVALAESRQPPGWLPESLRRPAGGTVPLTAVGMPPAVLRSALAAGTLTGAIVALPLVRPLTCQLVLSRVAGMREIPLVETRGYLLTRGPIPPLLLDGRGGFLIGTAR